MYPYITELDNDPPNYNDANQINPNHVDDKNHNGRINSDNYNHGNPLLSDYYPIIEDLEEANQSYSDKPNESSDDLNSHMEE